MKAFFAILIITLSFLYISGFQLKLRPFKMSFDDLPNGLGMISLIISLSFFAYSSYRKGKMDGYNEAIEDVSSEINKLFQKQKTTINQ